jgi:hypothetical protein
VGRNLTFFCFGRKMPKMKENCITLTPFELSLLRFNQLAIVKLRNTWFLSAVYYQSKVMTTETQLQYAEKMKEKKLFLGNFCIFSFGTKKLILQSKTKFCFKNAKNWNCLLDGIIIKATR